MTKKSWFVCLLLFYSGVVKICVGKPEGRFKSIPTTVKTTENGTVLLPCYLDDRETINSIEWYKDDVLIASSSLTSLAQSERVKMWGNGSLEVSELRDTDTGEYECRVTRADPPTSIVQLHAIEVMYPPSITSNPEPGDVTVILGQEVEFLCHGKGVPQPIIKWFYNDTEIELVDNRARLRFNVTDVRLGGVYKCEAENGVGEAALVHFNLIVTYAPELTSLKSWIHASPGLRVELECFVSAFPSAKVLWLKNDELVKYDSRVIAIADRDKHSLIIRNVRAFDFGNYSCKAINDVGETELYLQLEGNPNPAVFKQTDQNANGSKDEHTIVWEVDSYSPVFEYNLWFRPYQKHNTATTPEWKKLVIPAERSTGPIHSKAYTITGLSEKTIYEAVLVSRNRYGWSKPSPITIFATEGAELNSEVQTELESRIEDNVIPEEAATIASAHNGSVSYLMSKFLLVFIYFSCILYEY